MLVLQALNNLSDEQVEYQVGDRLSFTRFLRLGIEDRIPDGTTLWLFREKLAKADLIEKLFDRFDQHLGAQGYIARGGQIVDATIVAVPRQRNTRKENEVIKRGQTPEDWEKECHEEPTEGQGCTLDQEARHGRIVRTIGIVRARAKIGLQNLVYNIRRLVTLERMAVA
jgi:hypothetical protein